MKKLFIVLLIIIFSPTLGITSFVDIPPKDLQCKENEKAMCIQSCMSTLVFCGPFGTFENGKFIEGKESDCNTTTCSWNCICIPEPKELK